MLKIEIISEEGWDEVKEEFIPSTRQTLQLEHSLLSLSKWESKFHKSYIATEQKTPEELRYYIECMIITPNVNPKILSLLSDENYDEIGDYIRDPMTATVINRQNKGGNRRIITSELLYYYMTAFNIPAKFEKWHLNRLMTLIEVCNAEQQKQNGDQPTMSQSDLAKRNAEINAKNRAKYKSKG